MSRSRSRQGGPKQVVHYNFDNDPSGIRRLPQTQGIWKPIAYLGFIVMTVGLGVFGFVLISAFGAASGGVPKMPAELPIGFGIALAGAIAFQLGIGLGAPQDEPQRGDTWYIEHGIDIHATDGSRVSFGDVEQNVSLTINQQLAAVDDLHDAVARHPMDKRRRAAAIKQIDALGGAIAEEADDDEITDRLSRVTDVLVAAGALTGGATTVLASLLKLAGLLGDAGQGVYDWLRRQSRR
jgi:hypothetical protein